MKIKVLPEDFIVREESRIACGPRPDRYRIYRLEKRHWDSFDLAAHLARRLRVAPGDIRYGGLKDRHGRTEQLLSVRADGRPLPGLRENGFTLVPLGWSPEPVAARDVSGNRFTIVVRDLHPAAVEPCLAACEELRRQGLPNYYDEQRFGSARHGRGFMGKQVFLGRREKALRLYFQPSAQDDPRTRALKSRVIEHWGRWQECLEPAFEGAFGEYRRILEYLDGHRVAYNRALDMIDRKLLMFILNAYQSWLFNELLAGTLRRLQPGGEDAPGGWRAAEGFRLLERPYSQGTFLFPERLPPELFERLRALELPVPGYDSGRPALAEAGEALREVLGREGLDLPDLKARQLRGIDVKGTLRRALVLPETLTAGGVGEDERYPGRRRLTLELFLPRGAYATLLLKRLELAERAAPG